MLLGGQRHGLVICFVIQNDDRKGRAQVDYYLSSREILKCMYMVYYSTKKKKIKNEGEGLYSIKTDERFFF